MTLKSWINTEEQYSMKSIGNNNIDCFINNNQIQIHSFLNHLPKSKNLWFRVCWGKCDNLKNIHAHVLVGTHTNAERETQEGRPSNVKCAVATCRAEVVDGSRDEDWCFLFLYRGWSPGFGKPRIWDCSSWRATPLRASARHFAISSQMPWEYPW